MKFFKTWQQAYRYGKLMAQPTGCAFIVCQVEAGRNAGLWFAMPAYSP